MSVTFGHRAVSMPLLGFVLCAGLAGGCATGRGANPVDTPAAFLVLDGETSRPARAGEGCRNPMVDPRDGTRLELRRSASGLGDYQVPDGRYGVPPGDLLRLECATGRVVEIVRDRS